MGKPYSIDLCERISGYIAAGHSRRAAARIREPQITGTFGTETISVPRARVEDEVGKVSKWHLKALPRYQRLTKAAEAFISAVYLSGTNTRRVKRALFALFKGP